MSGDEANDRTVGSRRCPGVWGGVQAWSAPSFWMRIQAAAAILASVNLLFLTWFWSRARPGSSEALFFPGMILLSVAMLINVVPSLLWPTREALAMGASAVCIILTAIAIVLVLRGNRRLWAARLRG